MDRGETTTRPWGSPGGLLVFGLLQVVVMLLAISSQSLWIDEFWTAYFTTLGSVSELVELILIPSGSQTPLHFSYYYLWGQLFEPTELWLRLANLPLFVLGQVALYLALRDYPVRLAALLLALSALHPLVWQYADEARPYIMIYAGAEMLLAALLHLHARRHGPRGVQPLFTAIFALGGILLFGASLLGAFWVFAAVLYAAHLHHRHLRWRHLTRGPHLVWGVLLLATTAVLSVYYLNSLLQGAGGSRVSTTTLASLGFAAYELLGLSGIGPSRHALRQSGLGALAAYAPALAVAAVVVLATLAAGLFAAFRRLGRREWLIAAALAILPVAIVVASGFIMKWQVLGRHLMASLPVLNLLFALGLVQLLGGPDRRRPGWRWAAVALFIGVLLLSSLSMRFAERHRKDDYRTAVALATDALARGQQVWWAADYLGAHHYRVPGEFDYTGELTGWHHAPVCTDRPGVQATANLTTVCLQALSVPDLVVFARPETFDKSGDLRAYLQARGFKPARELPAITIWQAPAAGANPRP